VDAIAGDRIRHVAAPTVAEAAAVMISRKGPPGAVLLDALLQRLSIEVVPMDANAAAFARTAYARWGKGVGSPGVLDYGDCLAYGVAMAEGEAAAVQG
jgi:ribonuclease VapC